MEDKYKEDLFRYLKYLVLFIIIASIYSLFWGPWASYKNSLPVVRTVNVVGEGKVVVKPTLARVSLSIVNENKDSIIVQTQNTATMNKVIEFIKTEGIDEKDIKTTQFNLSPKYSIYKRGEVSSIEGYALTQEVSVVIRDLESVGSIISGVGNLGVNKINSISFDVSDEERDELVKEARELAFEDAKEDAKSMAKASGVRIGKIVNFYENRGVPYFSKSSSAYGVGGDSIEAITQIEPGSQDIIVNVNVSYQIK